MKRLVFLVVTLVYIQSCGKSYSDSLLNPSNEAVPIDSIEQFINHEMERMGIPGLSIAIINNAEVVYHNTFGWANVETAQPVDSTTLFEGASLSKPVFAHMVMFLVEEGQLDLDRPLLDYLDYTYPGTDPENPDLQKITARMVLSHTSGFPNWREDFELMVEFEPGSRFQYSGEGYQLLSKVVESILETDYRGVETYFEEKVARPFGMSVTKFVQDSYNIEHKSMPYENGEVLPLNRWEGAEFNPASAIHSEALDFSRWIIALLNEEGLSSQSYETLFTNQINVPESSVLYPYHMRAWALGFAEVDISGHKFYGHLGNNMGFTSMFLIDRESDWGLILFTNTHLAQDIGFELVSNLLSF